MGLGRTRFNLLSHPSLLKSCQYQIPYVRFCCEGWIRTTDLKVMSLPSYHCSTSRYILKDYVPLPQGHLSTSCAGCTSGCNQYFNVKELSIKNPTSYKGFLKLHTCGMCFTKIGKNSHSVKSFLIVKRFGVFVLSDMNI